MYDTSTLHCMCIVSLQIQLMLLDFKTYLRITSTGTVEQNDMTVIMHITTVHKPCRVVAQEYVFGATFHVVRLKQHFVVQLNNAHCAVTTQHLNVLTSLCFVALRYSNKPTLMTLQDRKSTRLNSSHVSI